MNYNKNIFLSLYSRYEYSISQSLSNFFILMEIRLFSFKTSKCKLVFIFFNFLPLVLLLFIVSISNFLVFVLSIYWSVCSFIIYLFDMFCISVTYFIFLNLLDSPQIFSFNFLYYFIFCFLISMFFFL